MKKKFRKKFIESLDSLKPLHLGKIADSCVKADPDLVNKLLTQFTKMQLEFTTSDLLASPINGDLLKPIAKASITEDELKYLPNELMYEGNLFERYDSNASWVLYENKNTNECLTIAVKRTSLPTFKF